MRLGSMAAIGLICILCSMPMTATPIMIAWTSNGLFLGTNEVNSGGGVHCKVHMARRSIVLRASPYVMSRGDRSLDLDKDLNRAIRGNDQDPQDLVNAVLISTKASLVHFIKVHPEQRALLNGSKNNFLIAGYKRDGSGVVLAITLTLDTRNPKPQFTRTDQPLHLGTGELFNWSGGIPDVRYIPQGLDVKALMDERLKEAQMSALQSDPYNQSFRPPFTIVRMSSAGQRSLVEGSASVCKVR